MKYLVLGDIHGCREYLELVPAFLDSVDGLICTGDVGGYGPDSIYCYETLMRFKDKLESKGKLCKIVRGNHEDGLELALKHPGISLKGIASTTAQIGFQHQAGQLFSDDIFNEGKVDSNRMKDVLITGWYGRLKAGNKNIIHPEYLSGLKKSIEKTLNEKIKPKTKGFFKGSAVESAVRSTIEQTLEHKNLYSFLKEREEQLSRAVNVLEFIVNLPEQESFEVEGEKIKVKHTMYDSEDRALYVVGEEHLEYMDRVASERDRLKSQFSRSLIMSPEGVFNSEIFNDCDTIFFGHVHSSDTYVGKGKHRGKMIVMANSPFPRDGKGTRAPFIFYHVGNPKKKGVKRADRWEGFGYDYEETERKLALVNKRFLGQIELYRKVKRKVEK